MIIASNLTASQVTALQVQLTADTGYTPEDAYALIDSVVELIKLEQDIAKGARDYVQDNKLGTGNPGQFADWLLDGRHQGADAPSWYNDAKPSGIKHSDSREIFTLLNDSEQYHQFLASFQEQAQRLDEAVRDSGNVSNVDGAREKIRELVRATPENGDQAKFSEMLTAVLNELGAIENPGSPAKVPASVYVLMKGVDKPETFLNARDYHDWTTKTVENIADRLDALGDNVKNFRAGEFYEDVKRHASEQWDRVSKAASELTGGGKDSSGGEKTSWWENIKDWFKELDFGKAAGGVGVGALFYLVGNALAGNSIIGKVIGLALGIMGAVMGAKMFGGKDDDAPSTTVQNVSRNQNRNQSRGHSREADLRNPPGQTLNEEEILAAQAMADAQAAQARAEAQCAIDVARANIVRGGNYAPGTLSPVAGTPQSCIDANRGR